ncbi:protein tilB homolog isoform X3 [Bombus vosnesenskii]|uniref:Protein tilB homolog isoform X3 n=2 Tax=Pyrobombus TaxID=144703 RepID=A0A6J3LEJ1_9HYME|nr:protein tilB homolog isoform X3 [Bombus vancouverensis nearcticus]XP_033305570.1 protein tilB homolog isoform X3 [Bombus bifarius]XP_033363777.1 protein tilB homolog isoform X3 [Bombus vosnesenskii]
MVKLTEEMVVARTRMSDFSAVKKLNCWGTELTDVSILRKMKNVEVLSLSVNHINTLADFQYCLSLQELFVRNNNIEDLNEVCYLQGLPNLRNLWLGENPCAEKEGYRLAVLKALPNLQKLDDEIVSPEEVQTALTRGRVLVHPLDMYASPPQSDAVSPEDITTEYIEETEVIRHRRYSSSSDQRSFEETQHAQEEYHDPDHRNANYNASPSHHYSQNNQYTYEEYDDRPAISRHNGDYDDRRSYAEYSNNDTPQRTYAPTSPRTQYSTNEIIDERRADRNSYDYDNRLKSEYKEHHDHRIKDYEEQHQPSSQPRRMAVHHNVEREDLNQVHGWVRHSDKEKCRSQFHYHRRPVTRNSNILSAVLCLVKELDYPSLEVVEMAVRNRMDELEE